MCPKHTTGCLCANLEHTETITHVCIYGASPSLFGWKNTDGSPKKSNGWDSFGEVCGELYASYYFALTEAYYGPWAVSWRFHVWRKVKQATEYALLAPTGPDSKHESWFKEKYCWYSSRTFYFNAEVQLGDADLMW